MAAPSTPWGTCTFCGDAVPPGADKCPTCSAPVAGPGKPLSGAKKARRLRLHRGLRVFLVAIVAVVLLGSLAYALYTGPPVAAAPLSGTWTFHLSPGRSAVIAGAVTGGDYITGNFSVLDPPGAVLAFEVFNQTEYLDFARGLPAVPAQAPQNSSGGLVDFAALVTDTYDFVWTNGYPSGSGINTTLYLTTAYESNVVVE